MSLRLRRTYRFSSSHVYRRPEWDEQTNRERFGKCAIEPGHGHNYRLTVWVSGEVDPRTGFLVDLVRLDECVRERVVEPLDHRHINAAVPEFAPGGEIPTSENLVLWIRRQLEGALGAGVRLVGLSLAEDEDLAGEWFADGGP